MLPQTAGVYMNRSHGWKHLSFHVVSKKQKSNNTNPLS